MDYFTKKRLVIWGFAILIIINLTALGTIIYFRFFAPPPKVTEFSPQQAPVNRPYVWDKLNFTEKQRAQMSELRDDFLARSKAVMDSLDNKRYAIIMELSMEDPDLSKLDKLTEDIGSLHAQLKKESIRHLLQMKEICTPEQHQHLTRLFIERMHSEDMGPGMGMRPRQGKGQGNRSRHGRMNRPFQPKDTLMKKQ